MAWYDEEDSFNFGDAFDLPVDSSFDFGGFDLSNLASDVFDVDFSSIPSFNFTDAMDLDWGDAATLPSFDFTDALDMDWGNIPAFNIADATDMDWGNIPAFNIQDATDLDWGNIPAFNVEDATDMDWGNMPAFNVEDATDLDWGNMPAFNELDATDRDWGGEVPTLADNMGDADAQEGGFYGNIYGDKYDIITDPITGMVEKYDKEGNYIETLNAPAVSDVYPDELERGPNQIGVDTSLGSQVASLVEKGKAFISGKDLGVGDAASGGSGSGDGSGGGGKGGTGGGSGGGAAGGSDMAKWLALLGGILGLLTANKGGGGAPGYKGTIPTYTATRGTPVSPTAGGRRAGGAGLGSLTGGVTYTKAAQGGLMDVMAGQPNESVLMMAKGGETGRYLRGATDGMADKIYTDIDGQQPARLSHGEFVIPADVVSHLGNGNSDAGAKELHDMMNRVRKARTGTTKQGKEIKPRKHMAA